MMFGRFAMLAASTCVALGVAPKAWAGGDPVAAEPEPEPDAEAAAAEPPDEGLRLVLRPWLEVFAGGAARVVVDAEDDWQPEFVLSRAHLGLDAAYEKATARITLEGVASTSGASLLGVAGESVVVRLREAWAGYRPWAFLDVQAGLLRTLAHPVVERAWGLRVVDRVAIERQGLAPPADLGIVVRGILPSGFGSVSVGGFNGDGYTMRELNRDKNLEVAMDIHPLAGLAGGEPFSVLLAYTLGTQGAAASRADRLTAGLLWTGRRIGGGATFTWAWGLNGAPDREGWLISAFARVEPIHDLILGVSGSHFRRDVHVAEASVSTVTGTVGYRLAVPLSVFVAVDRQIAASAAKAADPGADVWTVSLLARAALGP